MEALEKNGFPRSKCFLSAHIENYGTMYKRGYCIHLPREENDVPYSLKLGEIEETLMIQNDPYIYVAEFSTFYDDTTDIYLLTRTSTFILIKISELAEYLPMQTYEIGESRILAVCPRYNLLEQL